MSHVDESRENDPNAPVTTEAVLETPPTETVLETPPRRKHWSTLAELESSPEVKALREREFLTPGEDKSDLTSRREFLKLLGAGAAFAAAGCARKPVEKILPYVKAPEELTPGVPVYFASTCGECPAACGVLVKTREGRPIKLEGNKSYNKQHSYSQLDQLNRR